MLLSNHRKDLSDLKSVQDEFGFLKELVKGIARQFGSNCEVVLHDLKRPYESTIVAIENGHVTNRKVGDPGTNLGLELLRGSVENGNKFNYITQTKDGRLLRSTSIYLQNEQGKTIGALCINFDITELTMAKKAIDSITQRDVQPEYKEAFVNDVNELLDMLIQEAQDVIAKPVAMMSKEDKIEFIQHLDRRGAFLIKKSGERVCNYLNISKYTLYNYLGSPQSD